MNVSDFRQTIWITCNIINFMENLLTKIRKDRKIHINNFCKVSKISNCHSQPFSCILLSDKFENYWSISFPGTSITVNKPKFKLGEIPPPPGGQFVFTIFVKKLHINDVILKFLLVKLKNNENRFYQIRALNRV